MKKTLYAKPIVISKGAFGEIYLAYDETSRKSYAVKVSVKNNDQIINENKILSRLNHKHILRIEDKEKFIIDGLFQNYNDNILIMPYYRNGSLFDWLKNHGPFPLKVAKTLFRQLLDAVQHIHPTSNKPGIVHRDIKLDNVLLSDDFSVILIDFGLSNELIKNSDEFNCNAECGTDGFKPPETYELKFNEVNQDEFGLSVVFFCMVVGKMPFAKANFSDKKYKYLIGNQQSKEVYWTYFFKSFSIIDRKHLIDFFSKMFDHNPKNRLTLQQIIDYPWLLFDNASTKEVFEYMRSIQNPDKQKQNFRNFFKPIYFHN